MVSYPEPLCIYGIEYPCSTIAHGLLLFHSFLLLITAGDHSVVKEECKACAVPLIKADTLPEGLHRWQLPNFAGGLHLVRGELHACHHVPCAAAPSALPHATARPLAQNTYQCLLKL